MKPYRMDALSLRRTYVYILVCICIALFLVLPHYVSAQFGIPGTETILTLEPLYPAQGQSFTARIEAYSYDLNRSAITWSINGVVREEFSGEQSVSLTAPALGTPLRIAVRVEDQTGVVYSASATVVPSSIDIIVESNTRVPYFYRGRALPSSGSTFRAVAFPSIYRPSGVLVPRNELVYTWKLNGSVARSGLGVSTLSATMPHTNQLLIEVTAESTSGDALYTVRKQISPVEPQVFFYEENPLYGVSRNALPPSFTLLSDEVTVRAEPYFVSEDIFQNAQYGWTIDKAPVASQNADQQTLTLRSAGIEGSSEVEFSVRNLTSLLQAAQGMFTIYFE